MKSLSGKLILVTILLFSGPLHAETAIPALINDDEVRVRAEPSVKGTYVGVLYKNMLVTVLDQTATEQKVGEESHRWYKVRSEAFEGWTYGRYVSFDVPDEPVDTYTNRGDLQWLHENLREGVYLHPEKDDPAHITTDQYRTLITRVEASARTNDVHNPQLPLVMLGRTLYKHLAEHPNDPKFAYLKKKLFSDEFLADIVEINKRTSFPSSEFLFYSRYLPRISDKDLILSSVRNSSHIMALASDSLRNDKEFMLAAVGRNYKTLAYAGEIRSDRELIAATIENIKVRFSTADSVYGYSGREKAVTQAMKILSHDLEAATHALEIFYERVENTDKFNARARTTSALNHKFWSLAPRALWQDEEFVRLVSKSMSEYKECTYFGTATAHYPDPVQKKKVIGIIKENNRACRSWELRSPD